MLNAETIQKLSEKEFYDIISTVAKKEYLERNKNINWEKIGGFQNFLRVEKEIWFGVYETIEKLFTGDVIAHPSREKNEDLSGKVRDQYTAYRAYMPFDTAWAEIGKFIIKTICDNNTP